MRKREEEGQRKKERGEEAGRTEKDMGNLGEENKEGESEKGIQRKRERNGRGGRKGDFSGALYCIELILHNTCFASYKLRFFPRGILGTRGMFMVTPLGGGQYVLVLFRVLLH